jgi:hypothetical protein
LCCGSLRAEATGEPVVVGACHCTECQRRTGSPFSVSTYFPKEQVRTEGPSKVYVRGSDSGRKVEFHFCPDCGSTVFWYAELRPDNIGIAFGTFADPSMPWPTLSGWETTRHPWVTFDHQLDHFVRGHGMTEKKIANPPRQSNRCSTALQGCSPKSRSSCPPPTRVSSLLCAPGVISILRRQSRHLVSLTDRKVTISHR